MRYWNISGDFGYPIFVNTHGRLFQGKSEGGGGGMGGGVWTIGIYKYLMRLIAREVGAKPRFLKLF